MLKRYFLVCLFILYTASVNAYTYEEYKLNNTPINQQTQMMFGDYLDSVKTKLIHNWIAPDFVQNGHAKIVFKLDKEGYILSANIVESSGNELYDESAIYALQKSEPFGKIPDNYKNNTVNISYSFDTNFVNEDSMSDIKRLHAIKRFAKFDDSPFAYFYLAHCYERVGDIDNAIQSIERAISLTKLNSQYKRYRETLIK